MKKQILSLLLLLSSNYMFAGASKSVLAEVKAPKVEASWLLALPGQLVDGVKSNLASAKDEVLEFASANKKAALALAALSSYVVYKNCPWVQKHVDSAANRLLGLVKRKADNK